MLNICLQKIGAGTAENGRKKEDTHPALSEVRAPPPPSEARAAAHLRVPSRCWLRW